MDKITLSLDSLSDLFDINASELSTSLIVEKDGEKVAVDESQIKTVLSTALGKKMKTFSESQSSEKVEQARGRARKEAFKEVEDKAKEIGVDMRWESDGFTKLKSHFETAAPPASTEITDDQIRNSELYINKVKEMQGLIDTNKASYEDSLKGIHREKVNDKLAEYAFDLITKEGSGFVVGKDKAVTKNLINVLIASLNGKEEYFDTDEDGKLGIYKDGKLALAESNGFKPYNIDKRITAEAKNFFTVASAPDISAPNPDTSEAGKLKVKVGNEDKLFDLPTFKNAGDLAAWTNQAINDKVPVQVIQEATKLFNESQGS